MTRQDLQRLVDRLPEIAMDGQKPQLVVSRDDVSDLSAVVIELAKRLHQLTRELMDRDRLPDGDASVSSEGRY